METIHIGLIGMGTVGSGVIRMIQEHQEKIAQVTGRHLIVTKAVVKHPRNHQSAIALGIEISDDINSILDDDSIQLVVEVMGGIEPAKTYIADALRAGKHIVTANKDLIAQEGNELVQIAKEYHRDLFYEASVAGGIPILRTIVNSFAADRILEVTGIVNGTTNFILTQMAQQQMSYDNALKLAQDKGFAEADPTNDVAGIDAAYKMIILAQFAFGANVTLSQITRVGIEGVSLTDIKQADALGYVIKLIGSAKNIEGQLAVSVGPVLVPKSHPLAGIRNENNAVMVIGAAVGRTLFYGPGAGELPTANSVVSDIMAIAKNIVLGTTGNTFNGYRKDTQMAIPTAVESPYYFALSMEDISGQMLALTKIMTAANASFRQIIQTTSQNAYARVVMITHQMNQTQLAQIKTEISNLKTIKLLAYYEVMEERA